MNISVTEEKSGEVIAHIFIENGIEKAIVKDGFQVEIDGKILKTQCND